MPYHVILSSPSHTWSRVAVKSLAEASNACRDYISLNNIEETDWTGGQLTDEANKVIGRVTHGGKIEGETRACRYGAPLYDPGMVVAIPGHGSAVLFFRRDALFVASVPGDFKIDGKECEFGARIEAKNDLAFIDGARFAAYLAGTDTKTLVTQSTFDGIVRPILNVMDDRSYESALLNSSISSMRETLAREEIRLAQARAQVDGRIAVIASLEAKLHALEARHEEIATGDAPRP